MELVEKVVGIAGAVWEFLPGGKFQFQTQEIQGAHPRSVRTFKNLPSFIGDQYTTYFTANADKTWLIYDGERITFGRAWELIGAIGRELVFGFGVKKGDTVGVAMKNCPEFMLTFVAIQCIGGVAVPLNSLWKTEELEYAVKDSGCKVIFADAERMRRCAPFISTLGVTTILCRPDDLQNGAAPAATATFDAVVSAGETRIDVVVNDVVPEDESMIMYTSGSTGFPKGVVHTQRSLGTMMRLLELGVVIMPAVIHSSLPYLNGSCRVM